MLGRHRRDHRRGDGEPDERPGDPSDREAGGDGDHVRPGTDANHRVEPSPADEDRRHQHRDDDQHHHRTDGTLVERQEGDDRAHRSDRTDRRDDGPGPHPEPEHHRSREPGEGSGDGDHGRGRTDHDEHPPDEPDAAPLDIVHEVAGDTPGRDRLGVAAVAPWPARHDPVDDPRAARLQERRQDHDGQEQEDTCRQRPATVAADDDLGGHPIEPAGDRLVEPRRGDDPIDQRTLFDLVEALFRESTDLVRSSRQIAQRERCDHPNAEDGRDRRDDRGRGGPDVLGKPAPERERDDRQRSSRDDEPGDLTEPVHEPSGGHPEQHDERRRRDPSDRDRSGVVRLGHHRPCSRLHDPPIARTGDTPVPRRPDPETPATTRFRTNDHQEGVAAFPERREPNDTGT
jgi:hypothetical protein